MKLVAYYRVSTKEQGDSGLGLEAQRAAVGAFSKFAEGTVLAEYQEVETGKKSDRPKLQEALNHCKLAGATLVVAKLDRLARNVAFTSTLMESGINFVCCDNPHATPLTIHILAAVAEDEAKRISRRTKEALAALKARGVKLGAANPQVAAKIEGKRGWKKGAPQARAARARIQRERYGAILPMIIELRAAGRTLSQIADSLNAQGFVTTRGTKFIPSTVMRVLDRQNELASLTS